MTIIIGHRGASAHEPENTLRSFRRAVELGADAVEFDVRKTKDGHLVIMHDETVNRTTNGSGSVSSKTLEELRSLDAGLGERVPTLEEVVEAVGGRARLVVEIKTRGLWSDIVRVLRERNRLDALIISFLSEEIAEMKRAVPEMKAAILFRGAPPTAIQRAAAMKADVAGFRHDVLRSTLLEEARVAGLEVLTWTVEDPALAKKLSDLGVSYIAANAPDRILSAVAR